MSDKTKRFFVVAIMLCVLICFAGCASREESLNSNIIELESKIVELETEIFNLETERATLLDENTSIKVKNGTAKYIVTFNIKQKHFTLSIGKHIKDVLNDISIQIPVDKEYYDGIEIGDTIADDFRFGSFILYGSFGNWDVTVEDKSIH